MNKAMGAKAGEYDDGKEWLHVSVRRKKTAAFFIFFLYYVLTQNKIECML